MWTESFFTVYQALDWEFFSDAEGTFSQLSGPVKKKRLLSRENVSYAGLCSHYTQNRFYAKDFTEKGFDLAYAAEGISRECFVPAGN